MKAARMKTQFCEKVTMSIFDKSSISKRNNTNIILYNVIRFTNENL